MHLRLSTTRWDISRLFSQTERSLHGITRRQEAGSYKGFATGSVVKSSSCHCYTQFDLRTPQQSETLSRGNLETYPRPVRKPGSRGLEPDLAAIDLAYACEQRCDKCRLVPPMAQSTYAASLIQIEARIRKQAIPLMVR